MNDLLQTDRENIWHPFTPLQGADDPLLITSASGIYLHTHDGRKIIDAVSSWWVNIHGHAHPAIADALAKQARTLEHVIFAGFTHEPAIIISKNLKTILPVNQSKIFFSDNGSTAVEVALKMAFQYWHNQGIQRKNVVAINGAYHGDTFGSMSVGERGIFTNPFSNYLFDTYFIDFPQQGEEENVLRQFTELLARNNVGVFIFEPLVQGASGMRMYDAAILDRLISVARENNIVCIADEVFTGFGRTGKFFASDYLTHKPDIMAMSKGLTGGTLPLGVTSCSERIVEAFETADFLKTFFHGHSYTANPLSCTAANASFELLTAPGCQQNINRISSQHQQFAESIRGHAALSSVRCLGTILALEVRTEGAGYTSELRKRIYRYFLGKNILLRPLGNTIYVLPPYIISAQELELVYAAIADFVATLK